MVLMNAILNEDFFPGLLVCFLNTVFLRKVAFSQNFILIIKPWKIKVKIKRKVKTSFKIKRKMKMLKLTKGEVKVFKLIKEEVLTLKISD